MHAAVALMLVVTMLSHAFHLKMVQKFLWHITSEQLSITPQVSHATSSIMHAGGAFAFAAAAGQKSRGMPAAPKTSSQPHNTCNCNRRGVQRDSKGSERDDQRCGQALCRRCDAVTASVPGRLQAYLSLAYVRMRAQPGRTQVIDWLM